MLMRFCPGPWTSGLPTSTTLVCRCTCWRDGPLLHTRQSQRSGHITYICRRMDMEAYCTENCSRLSLKLMSFQSTKFPNMSSTTLDNLYSLFKEQPCGMAEKPVLPGTPTGSLPNLKHLQGALLSFKLPIHFSLAFTFGPRLY